MTLEIFNILVLAWMGLAVVTLVLLFFLTAPYGRHTTSNWGPSLSHIAGWILMEAPALLIFDFFFLTGEGEKTPVLWIIFAAWTFHYINRVLIFPFRQRNQGKRMPLMVSASGVFFNLVNGFFNGYFLGNYADGFGNEYFLDPRFIIGVLLFGIGMYINWRSDKILFNLRKPGETGYKIPYGGWYRFVSCPNYFGEIVEWTGFVIMVWNLPAVSFLLWTIANLLPRAIAHHKWYREKFEDYPVKRKALFPFLF